jgi:hypothetical protein
MPPFPGPWVAHLALDVAFMFVWYALLLRVVRKPAAILRTCHRVVTRTADSLPISDVFTLPCAALLRYFYSGRRVDSAPPDLLEDCHVV